MSNPKRVAVVGPLPPTRSGIARHTSAVAVALSTYAKVRVWSYQRQYPKFLYPGTSELSEDLKSVEHLNERRILDGVNPWTWLKTAIEIRRWKPDLLVFPVWTFFQAPSLGLIAGYLRRFGCGTCAIVHNTFDHESSFLKRRLSLWCLRQANRYVTHGTVLAGEISDHIPQAAVSIFPHPLFDDFPTAQRDLQRDAALELLFFGLVRPYKGLDIALRALALSGRKDIHLTIAGEFWEGLDETKDLIRELELTKQIELIPTYISDVDAADLFNRCDALVLPYRSVTGSGIVAMSLYYKRAVIVSDHPGLADLVEQFHAGWVFPSEDEQSLANIFKSLDRSQTKQAGENAEASASILTWDNFARVVLGHGEGSKA